MITVTPLFNDRTKDLLAAVLLALGGSMQAVKPLFHDTKDDLLYAILERLSSPNNRLFSLVSDTTVLATNNNRQTVNYPTIIGATGVVIDIGGFFLENKVDANTRYFLADTITGNIDFPPMAMGEKVLIFKY